MKWEDTKIDPALKEKITKIKINGDNFLKMALIFLRIESNIPIILMGETGIGKTSLIELLKEIM